jgi:hypothetical protein
MNALSLVAAAGTLICTKLQRLERAVGDEQHIFEEETALARHERARE